MMAREPGGPPWRILAVDGDPAVQAFYRGALAARSPGAAAPEGAAPYGEEAWRDMTFDVVVCASSHEALPLAREARQTGKPFAVAFVDAGKGAEGVEASARLRETDPGLQIVLVANGVDLQAAGAGAPPSDRLLWVRKPFQAPEARQFASALSAKWQMERRAEAAAERLRLSAEQQQERLAEADSRLRVEIDQRLRAEEECGRLRAALADSQRLRALGELAGGVAHDFNNLLTGILGHADIIKRLSPPNTASWSAADTIERAVDRAADLAGQLLGFARKDPAHAGPASVHAVIGEILHLMEASLSDNIRVETRLKAASDLVEANAGEMNQVLLNLVVNARDAMPRGGRLTIETALADLDEPARLAAGCPAPGRYLKVAVRDTGKGVPPGLRERIFEPFFTTKDPGKGAGMGLAVVDSIVRNHQGAIQVGGEDGKGAVFTVYLPSRAAGSPARPAAAPAEARGVPAFPPGLFLLLVDDEEVILDVGRKMLEALGCQVATASHGRQAIEVYRQNRERVALVLMDMMMPGMSGAECLTGLREIDPKVKVVFSTGYVTGDLTVDDLVRQASGFIQKPYRLERLASVIREVMAKDSGT